jgi:predicted PurR-regulated permease PerM
MSERTDVWRRVPDGLRAAAITSACLLLVAGAVYVVGVAAVRLATLSIAVGAAILLAALLEPLVNGLTRRGVPRWLGAAAAILLIVAAFVAPAVLLWRLTLGQFADLSSRLQQGLDRTVTYLASALPLREEQIDQALSDVQARIQQLSPDPLSGALTLLEIVAAVLLAIFVAFFLVKDGASMKVWLLGELPASTRQPVDEALSAGWTTITRYVRGILIVAAIDAVGIGVALALIGVPLALPLALLVFVGGFIPYVGAAVTGAVAVLVALAANGPTDALLTLLAVIAVQQLEGNFLEPVVVGRQVRLHPVAVVIVVFAGSLLAGVVGAIVAVPLTAVVYRIYRVRRGRPVPAHDPIGTEAGRWGPPARDPGPWSEERC